MPLLGTRQDLRFESLLSVWSFPLTSPFQEWKILNIDPHIGEFSKSELMVNAVVQDGCN